MRLGHLLSRTARTCRTLLRCESGSSAVEFAILAPVFIGMGLTGTEVAYLASTQLQVSQIAVSVADNASRLGQTDNSSVTPVVTEADVNSVLFGALKQGGSLDLQHKGRVILSSLEYDDYSKKQFIHWQRCTGNLTNASRYGPQGTGLNGVTLTGVGTGTSIVKAPSGSAVMVAEVYYQVTGLFGSYFITQSLLHQEAEFLNRDNRNIGTSASANNGLSPNATSSTC